MLRSVSDDHYRADRPCPVRRCPEARLPRDGYGQGTSNIPATDELKNADCLVLLIRRLALPKAQLAAIREYLDAGRPLVALRTASHAFDVLGESKPGEAEGTEFDADVLGGNYHGHTGNAPGSDFSVVEAKRGHPILASVEPREWHSSGSLYKVSPLADPAADVLMVAGGRCGQPVWTRSTTAAAWFTSLGHPGDFSRFRNCWSTPCSGDEVMLVHWWTVRTTSALNRSRNALMHSSESRARSQGCLTTSCPRRRGACDGGHGARADRRLPGSCCRAMRYEKTRGAAE